MFTMSLIHKVNSSAYVTPQKMADEIEKYMGIDINKIYHIDLDFYRKDHQEIEDNLTRVRSNQKELRLALVQVDARIGHIENGIKKL